MTQPSEKEPNVVMTQRERVMELREAFEAGVAAVWHRFNLMDNAYGKGWEGSEELAAKRYPLPKVSRPRVVTNKEGRWRFANDRIEWQSALFANRDWEAADSSWTPTGERVLLWASLVNEPFEEVEDKSPAATSR